MEVYSHVTRFILSCNYPTRIIDPIQDRCAVFRFRPLADDEILAVLDRVTVKTGLIVEEKSKTAVVRASRGSLRRFFNVLEQLRREPKITEEAVNSVCPKIKEDMAESLLTVVQNGTLEDIELRFFTLHYKDGVSVDEIFEGLFNAVVASKLTDQMKFNAVRLISDSDYYTAIGANSILQTRALLVRLATTLRGK